MKFKLEIELGSDGMQTALDVTEAIERSVAWNEGATLQTGDHARLMDVNGNKVGQWEVSE